MAALLALDTNWRRSNGQSPGRVVQLPSNYGTAGRLSFWHWLRIPQIPQVPATSNPLFNALLPAAYHYQVSVVPVTLTVPIQTTPQMSFTPAGTAIMPSGSGGSNPFAQVWTGAG